MSYDDDRINALLEQLDSNAAVKAEHKQSEKDEKVRFLNEFKIAKARTILPAFGYFGGKQSQAVKFHVLDSGTSVQLSISVGGSTQRVGYRADSDRRQVEVVGVPNYATVGLSRQRFPEPLFIATHQLTEEVVRGHVESALVELVQRQ